LLLNYHERMKGIYSKRCWIEDRLQEATVFFEDGIITNIKKGTPDHFNDIYKADENILMPGVIDAHVHINEPGRTEWEGFDTATQAAAAGGITSIIDMPLNASPVTTTAKAFIEKLAASERKMHVNVGFYGGLIPGNLKEIEELIQQGVLGIKAFLTHSGIDEFPNVGENELNAAAPIFEKYNIPLLVHCELTNDRENNLDEHPTSYTSYLNSRPKEWESKAVELMINICRKYKSPVHIVHVSSAETLDAIQKAKQEGLPVTAETCPHYILFNAEGIRDGETIYKCAPPIREKENNEELKQALKNKILDFIATDHSPAPPSLKEIESGNFKKAWGGIAGLQLLLPASWTALGETLSLEQFIPLLTENTAQFLKIEDRKGFIKEGYDADFVVWSPGESFMVTEDLILHKHKISPYIGKQLQGVVLATIINGEIIFSNNKILSKNRGRWLLRK
jgi:allantoinase